MDTQEERSPEPEIRRRPRWRTPGSWPWKVIIPWALFAVAAAAAVTFGLLWADQASDRDRIDEVERTTQRFVTALTNFSAAEIEEDVAEIRSFAVGDFASEVETFFGPDAIDAIRQAEATSEGEIEAIFVQDIDEGFASVFVVVRETVTNSVLEEPQTDVLRLEVGLTETSDVWKVNNVDIFQAPGTGGIAPGLP